MTFRSFLFPTLICLLLPLGVSCSSFTNPSPPVDDSTFARVLVDLHLLSARGQRGEAVPPSLRDSVYLQHGIDADDFDHTLRYYSRRPDEFRPLYRSVIDSLKSIQSVLQDESLPGGMPDSVKKEMPSLRR